MKKIGTAYVFWLGGLLGLAGLHRLYNGQIFTGLLWLFTFGLFGVGQLADLLLIPNMVENQNARIRSEIGSAMILPTPTRSLSANTSSSTDFKREFSRNQAVIDLLTAAEARGGKLSVTQGVMATGLSFSEVERLLREMVKSGYVEVGNAPETGVVLYEFTEL